MSLTDTLGHVASATASSLKSVLKMLLQSRRVTTGGSAPEALAGLPVAVLGNGPSLRQTLDLHGDALAGMALMAVNFAASTPEFFSLRPAYYILADPHFFETPPSDNVARLSDALARVDWPLRLFVPASRAADASRLTKANPSVAIATFNPVAVEGYGWLENATFDAGLGMPRPRNVLIPALMTVLRLGFKTIYVAGADHTWIRTLSVNEHNEVVSVQPHFYTESGEEKERITQVYRNVRLHEVLYSQYVAFKSYFAIDRYARRKGANIVNVTPGSFIDAFGRGTL